MRDRTIFYLVGLTLLSVFLLTVSWEFVFEDIVGHLFSSDFEKESLQTHWEFVITGTSLAAIALIIPTLVSLRSVTERRRAEHALEDSEEKFRNLVAGALQGILIHRHHKPLFVNRAWADLHGYAPEEVMAMDSVVPHIAPSDRARLIGYKDARLKGRSVPTEYEYQAVKKDGSTIHLVNHVRCVRWGGQPAIQTTVIDITELKRTEEELREARDDLELRVTERTKELADEVAERTRAEAVVRESEERYRRIYENTPVMLHSIDKDGRLLSVSDHWLEVLGYDRDEVIGNQATDFMTDASARHLIANVRPVFMKTGRTTDLPLQFVKKNGSVIDVLVSAVVERDEGGEYVRSLTVLTDVTERKRAEERFRSYFDLPLVGSAIYAPDKRWIEVNDKLCDILGYTRDELMALNWADITHPDDIAENLRLFDRALSGEGDNAYTMDKRFIRKDGETIQTSISAQCVRRPDGAPDYFIVLIQDITERKQAEEALRESQARLIDAIESISEGFVLYDADERLVLCNSKYREFYPMIADVLKPGRRLEDIVRTAAERGQIIQAVDDVDGWIRERLIQYRSARGTQEQHLSDGRWLVVSERRTREGGIVGVRTEFTERERAEEALRESEERLRAIVDSIVVGVITIDEYGVVHSFNPGAERIFGFEPDEVVGESITMLMPEPHRSGHDGYIANYLHTGEANIIGKGREVEGRRKDGSIFPMELEIGEMVVGGRQMFTGIVTDITERKRAEERFRNYFDVPLVGSAIYAPDKRWIEVNDKLCDLFGYTRDELMALTWVDVTHPDDLAENLRLFDRVLAGEGDDAYTMDKRFVRKDGEIIHTSISTQCVRRPDGTPDYFILLIEDITERKRAGEALRESEERFRTIAENVPGNVYRRILHPDGYVTWAYLSPGLRDLMELEPADVIARPELLTGTLHEDDRAMWEETVQKSVETLEPYVLEYRRITPSGKVKWMRTIARPHRRDNGAVVWDGVTLEITEEKKAQAQLIQASKLATLGEMASGIAHELNQPLSVVGMSAELSLMSMEAGEFDIEFVRNKLEKIVGQRDRMAEIIDHMRLFSRTDKARLESFNPVDAVAGGIRMVEQQFRAAGIELEMDCPADCRNVSGYPLQLEQVVLNLLTNARDAVLAPMDPAGSGTGDPAPRVRVSLVDDKRRKTVVISVADNGGGIPEAALKRIFDPFFTTKTEGHGTGLGLSISYSIIDAMGGRLEAQDTESGAVFQISLPVPANGAAAVSRGKGKNQKTRTRRTRARLPRILVVDDEEVIVEEVAEYLGRKGYDVATAGNGREALDLHQARPADVVVTDLFMPEMGGAELIRRLHIFDPHLPIVVVTGHTTFGDDRDIVAEGASVVLKKPIVLRELTDSLKELRQR